MIRQAVFSTVLGIALGTSGGTAVAVQAPPAPSSRPPAEIPFSRLKAEATLPLVLEPGAVASEDAVWTAGRAGGAVVRIEAKDNTVGAPIAVGAEPCASLVVFAGSLWVPLCGDHAIARVDPKERKVTATLKAEVAGGDGQMAASVGSIWAVTDQKGVLSRIDPDTNAPVAEIYMAGGARAVVMGEDALWVTSGEGNRLTRVNPHNNEVVETIAVGPKPGRLAVGEGGVWTLNADGTVTRVDPSTNKLVATITVGDDTVKGEITAGAGSVWVSAPGAPIIRIDPRTNRAVQRFTGEGGGAVLFAHGSLWVAAGTQTWRLDPKLVAAVRP